MRALTPFSFLLLLLSLSGPGWAAPGDPDPTWVYPTPAVLEPDSTDVVPMPVGWMVVRSNLPAAPATTSSVQLTRIDADGRPVTSFGTDGRVVTQLPGPFNVSLAAASTSDGGFVVAGYKRLNNTGDTVAAVVKLNAQGQVDTAFGDGGIIDFDSPFALDRVGAIESLEDGRIALLAWARVVDNRPYDCSTDRTVLWYLSPDGRQRQEVHAIAKDSYAGSSCRTAMTLVANWDDQDPNRVLHGNEIGIFEDTTAIMPSNCCYGPFAPMWPDPLLYSYISGSGIELRGGPTPSASSRAFYSLGQIAGFGGEPISWSTMEIDLADRTTYLGASTDGGRVAIARFTWTGTLDTGWGDGDGVVVIEGAGTAGPMAFEGIANDVRLLQVTGDTLVVATGDGVISRIQTGSADSSGAFVLRPPLDTVRRTNGGQTFSVVVERAGSSSGVATVQYAIKDADCARGQCSPNWGQARAGEDFVATSGTLRWEDGDSSDRTIRVDLLNKSTTQSYELLVAELSNPSEGARIVTGWAHIFLDQGIASKPTLPPSGSGSGNGGSSGGGGAASIPLLLLLLGSVAASRNRRRS